MVIPDVYTDEQGNHYQTFRNVYRILSQPGVTNRDRERLRDVILEARSKNLSVEEAQDRIAREVPVFNNFLSEAVLWSANSNGMKAAANWSQVLSFIIAVMALFYTVRNSASGPSASDMEEAFRRALLQTQQSAPANITSPPMPEPTPPKVIKRTFYDCCRNTSRCRYQSLSAKVLRL
jgi:hypothetical protein